MGLYVVVQTNKSLKRQNAPAVAGVLLADTMILAVASAWPFDLQSLGWREQVAGRAVIAAVVPVAVLLLASLLPSTIKAVLVFWRLRDVLPGHRAFTKATLSDPRIDVSRLQKHVGQFPTTPKEQNATWYRLFKKVEQDPSIQHAHGQYLLLRDIASISALLVLCAIAMNLFLVVRSQVGAAAVVLFTSQYLLAAISARFQGGGLVKSVLAMHAAKRHA
jgi:hypothetical protein